MKEAWEFLHSEGHINQGVLQGEPADQAACGSPPLACQVMGCVYDETDEIETPTVHMFVEFLAWVSFLACNRLHTEVLSWRLESVRTVCDVQCLEVRKTGLLCTCNRFAPAESNVSDAGNFRCIIVSRDAAQHPQTVLCKTSTTLHGSNTHQDESKPHTWAGTRSIYTIVSCLLACLLAHAACLAFGRPSTTNLLPNLLALMHNHYNTCMLLAAAEAQEPYPTTEALLEKLQEVLEKADVEVCSLQAVHHAIAMSHWHTSAPQIVCSCACFHHQ